MSERLKEPVLKTGDGSAVRGFKSRSLRQQKRRTNRVLLWCLDVQVSTSFLCFKTKAIFNIYNYLTLFKIKIVRQKCGAINKLAWHNIKPVGKHNNRFKQYHLSVPCEIFRLRLFFG